MSWTERYNKTLTITTGDGKTWEVFTEAKYLKEVEYHGTGFSFIGIDGQLIKKEKLNIRTFPLEFYFTGDLHLEISERFEASTLDRRPWIIEHPYYNTLLVQVLSLKFDNAESFDYTKINCIAQETLDADDMVGLLPIIGVIKVKAEEANAAIIDAPLAVPTEHEIINLKQSMSRNRGSAIKIIQDPIDAESYFNTFNAAQSAINSITATPIAAMNEISNMIKAPARFYAGVVDRSRVFLNQFYSLRNTIAGITTLAGKQLYAAQAQMLLAGFCDAASRPIVGDYSTIDIAENIKSDLLNAFRIFRSDVDGLQNQNATGVDSYLPDFNSFNSLQSLVNFTVSNILSIALNGRKQMSYVLTEDSNIFLLTHKFKTLDKNDSNLIEFIQANKFTWEEIALGIEKGKTVTYYV